MFATSDAFLRKGGREGEGEREREREGERHRARAQRERRVHRLILCRFYSNNALVLFVHHAYTHLKANLLYIYWVVFCLFF